MAETCICLCARNHGDRMGICDTFHPATARWFHGPFGWVRVPLCQPCADAQPSSPETHEAGTDG